MSEEKQETLTFKKTTIWQTATFVLLGLLIISVFTSGFGLKDLGGIPTTQAVGQQPSVQAPTVQVNTKLDVKLTENEHILGEKNAKIKMLEFSDFECPFCGRVFSDALAQLKISSYFKTGKVNLIYKHLPLNSIHQYAQKAAEASECAAQQGKFWEYHDLLFANQQALTIPSLQTYAKQLGLDTTKFNTCLETGATAAKIKADMDQATSLGARGTPYFVLVNDKGETQTISGAAPWANFEAAINALL